MQFRIRLLTSAALVVAGTAHAAVTFDANLEHDVMFKAKQGSTKGETSCVFQNLLTIRSNPS